jgi:hypothetical protein
VNHAWEHDGPAATALARSCALCGAQGRRSAGPKSGLAETGLTLTRWETRVAEGQPWVSGRVPPCPVQRKSTYTSVHVLIERRLKAEGIIPQGAEVTLAHLPGDWRQRSSPERPAWRASWEVPPRNGIGTRTRMSVFSCYSMRRCAEAAEVHLQYGQVIPCKRGETS